MIGLLEGKVKKILNKSLILLCNGIGFEIFVYDISSYFVEQDLTLFIYFHIKEDERVLYGFKTMVEKEFFLVLLSANGVGPKTAMNILSIGDVKGIASAIKNKNIKYLKSLPSVGTKLAQQLIICLFDKIDNKMLDDFDNKSVIGYEALINLGFTREEALSCINNIDRKLFNSDEDYISRCLKYLSR